MDLISVSSKCTGYRSILRKYLLPRCCVRVEKSACGAILRPLVTPKGNVTVSNLRSAGFRRQTDVWQSYWLDVQYTAGIGDIGLVSAGGRGFLLRMHLGVSRWNLSSRTSDPAGILCFLHPNSPHSVRNGLPRPVFPLTISCSQPLEKSGLSDEISSRALSSCCGFHPR
jgi:hypothetical protein